MKTALITGASSGIGRDIARELSRQGWRLLLAARRRDRLEALAKELQTPCRIYVCDVSKKENCIWLHEQTRAQGVSLLVNAAGFGLFGNFSSTELNRELEMIDVNIRAVHILTKLFLRDFIKQDAGAILNVASSAGFFGGSDAVYLLCIQKLCGSPERSDLRGTARLRQPCHHQLPVSWPR